MNKYIGAIDQGTTSTRFMVFDHQAGCVSRAQKEHRQYFPHPGWVEHDPKEIWQNTAEVIEKALHQAGLSGKDLAAIGLSNQRETTVVWDKTTGEPLHRAIVWQCTRTSSICQQLKSKYGQHLFEAKTGLPISTYFSAGKMKWLLENIPKIRNSIYKGDALLGTIDSWLIWWLTGGPVSGVHITDVTNASRTQLMNIQSLNWDYELLDIFNIPDKCLARIVPSTKAESLGITSEKSPFQEKIPITAALGDQQAALVGQLCFGPGQAKNTYGTGSFLLLNTGKKMTYSRHGLLTTLAYQYGDQDPIYCLEGSISMAGALINWFRDNLGLIDNPSEIEKLACQVNDTDGLILVPAFSGLLAPHWDTNARGLLTGITRSTTKNHLARAVLEAIAFQTKDIIEAMNKEAPNPITCLKVDGGVANNGLLMQLLADILNIPIVRPSFIETSALGAALAAGQAFGFWSESLISDVQMSHERTWPPSLEKEQRLKKIALWESALKRTLTPL